MSVSKTTAGHKARKRFGQNFLVDQSIITHIVRSVAPREGDNIVEIGPGQGAITGLLLDANPRLNAIELDRDLIPILLAQFAKYREFKIHQTDALHFDYATLYPANEESCSELQLKNPLLRIVGNLPYNISTPLIFHLLSFRGIVKDMHFMLQKEVVARLAAGPGDKNYGRLSIMAQYYCEVEHLFDVPPESFDPAPKVESAIVRLTPYTLLPAIAENLGNFEHMVKTAFQQRRKTLRNGLKALVSDEQAQQVGLDLTLRAENLSMQEYVRLSNTLWGSNDIGDAIL